MELIVDLHRRSAGAVAQAIDGFQRHFAVRRGGTEIDTQTLLHMGLQRPGTHCLAGFGAAHLNHMLTGGRSAEMVVKTDDAMDLGA
jgi:hypothetical protein